jgi:outer membrane protein insertion porin family
LRKRHTRWLIATILLAFALRPAMSALEIPSARPLQEPSQESSTRDFSSYEGKMVLAIYLPGVPDDDRQHTIDLLPQKVGEPLDRNQVRESLRRLYGTGRFANIQAEAVPSGNGVILTFTTSENFFVGAVLAEGAPARPNENQIVNAAKLQLGDVYTQEKLNRALENIRQVLQENGYYQARVTAESTSNAATQQIDVLFHVTAGPPAHVGEIKVTGTSDLSPAEVQNIAHMQGGDRVTSVRVSNSLQRLRKRFQKQNRALAQVTVASQVFHLERNAVDFTYQIDPGPVVVITAQGFHISRGVMKKEIPVYEENAVDDDLLNEGKRNLLDYLQTRGHFDAKVDFQKQTDANTLRVTYQIDPGPRHRLVLVEITGNKDFLDTTKLRSYLQIEPATRTSSGRYSGTLLKNDVATLEGLYRSNGFRQVKIETKVDDDYKGVDNHLAVHIRITEGPRTLVGDVHVAGNEKFKTSELPELSTQSGQPYSEEDLASDRTRVLNFYFNNGYPNASLEISTKESASDPSREDVDFSIEEGEGFTVNRVMVGGTDHTRDYVVERELQISPGQPLSEQALLDTQTRLYNLGIFSQVDTAVQNPRGDDPLKNILVQVEESKRYTFTYGAGLEFETGLPAGSTQPTGATGVSPRIEFDVTRLNMFGRNQTIAFQSHVGRLQQRGLISYTIPKLLDSDKWKLIYTVFYDNSLDVSTFTSQRLEGRIDLRQQIGNSGVDPEKRAGPNSMTYRFEFRRVKASNFATGFNPGELALLSAPATVGGPGFTFIHDKRDNPLESTKGDYFTLDAFAAAGFLGSRSDTQVISPITEEATTKGVPTNFGRILAQDSTYYALGKKRPGHQFVLARSTSVGLQQPFRGTRVVPPGACPVNVNTNQPTCTGFPVIPLPELFFTGGGNSHRGFGLNQAGPRDPTSGFPLGGTALFVNNVELRLPPVTLPLVGEGFSFAVFHDMGNVFTAQHDMVKGFLRWHQPPNDCPPIEPTGTTTNSCYTHFNDSGYDYTSHAVGVGVRYKTPIGPLRFDFGYNLNPTQYFQAFTFPIPNTNPPSSVSVEEPQRLRHFNVFFSIGQPF